MSSGTLNPTIPYLPVGEKKFIDVVHIFVHAGLKIRPQ